MFTLFSQFLYVFTHAQSRQVIVNLNDILDCVSNGTDNTVNDMHNSIGGNLVAIDNPSAVHSHHLHTTYTMLNHRKVSMA